MLLPAPLKIKDHAVIVSPSGKIDDNLVYDTVAILEEWGLKTEIGKFALGETGRFSGTLTQRLYDLQTAFDDPSVKLIFCSRGGYGVVHLLDKLDFSFIKKHPKWVIGYSDITALHAALQKNGIASLHGPMAKHFSNEGADNVSVRYTKSILTGQPIEYEIPIKGYVDLNRNGTASGRLFGGNLSVFCGLIGTKYLKVPDKGILFIEDTGEAPYKVDRMIHQLKLSGLFSRLSGMFIGQFDGYEEDNQMYTSLLKSIREVINEYDFPVCFNFPVGHVGLNFPLIMGHRAEIAIDDNQVNFRQDNK